MTLIEILIANLSKDQSNSNQDDAKIEVISLKNLGYMFDADEKYISAFEHADGIENLERLQYSRYQIVVKHAQDMLVKYFEAQEMMIEDDQNQPNNAQEVVH